MLSYSSVANISRNTNEIIINITINCYLRPARKREFPKSVKRKSSCLVLGIIVGYIACAQMFSLMLTIMNAFRHNYCIHTPLDTDDGWRP